MAESKAKIMQGKSTMHDTQNNTKSNAKQVSISILSERLADGIDLNLAIKQAHWNLKGPDFIGIHLMLDKFHEEVDEFNDMVAERITQLGGTAKGTVAAVAEGSQLAPYPLDIFAIADHLAALIDRYAVYANSVRKNIDETDDAGDAVTCDLLTEISRGVDKQLWFLEAHVQEPPKPMRDGDKKGKR